MVLIKIGHPDVGADISREMEYQRRRGSVPTMIEVSPEAHEAMRLMMKAPTGAELTEHDEIPVRVNRKLIGVKSWRVLYAGIAPFPEKQADYARRIR